MPLNSQTMPEISATMQLFIRAAYGLLCLGTLAFTLPYWRTYFLSERWNGYTESDPLLDRIHNPAVLGGIFLVWIAALISLVAGIGGIIPPLVNLVFAYHFFIQMRWKGLLRGMGAPGFMWFWLAAAVFLLELTSKYAGGAHSLALMVLRIDFAIIMLTSGVSKITSGYLKAEGVGLNKLK